MTLNVTVQRWLRRRRISVPVRPRGSSPANLDLPEELKDLASGFLPSPVRNDQAATSAQTGHRAGRKRVLPYWRPSQQPGTCWGTLTTLTGPPPSTCNKCCLPTVVNTCGCESLSWHPDADAVTRDRSTSQRWPLLLACKTRSRTLRWETDLAATWINLGAVSLPRTCRDCWCHLTEPRQF